MRKLRQVSLTVAMVLCLSAAAYAEGGMGTGPGKTEPPPPGNGTGAAPVGEAPGGDDLTALWVEQAQTLCAAILSLL